MGIDVASYHCFLLKNGQCSLINRRCFWTQKRKIYEQANLSKQISRFGAFLWFMVVLQPKSLASPGTVIWSQSELIFLLAYFICERNHSMDEIYPEPYAHYTKNILKSFNNWNWACWMENPYILQNYTFVSARQIQILARLRFLKFASKNAEVNEELIIIFEIIFIIWSCESILFFKNIAAKRPSFAVNILSGWYDMQRPPIILKVIFFCSVIENQENKIANQLSKSILTFWMLIRLSGPVQL